VLSDNTGVIAAVPSMPQLQQLNMPDQIMKEVEFQQDKRKKRKFEAFEFNQLCGDEVDCNFEAEAEAFFEDRKKNTNGRKAIANLTNKIMPGEVRFQGSCTVRCVF